MNNYYESAAFLINSDKYAYYPDAFKLRLNFVMQSESSLIGIRRVPAYLTDIGVRKFSDPKFYFEQIIKKFHPKLNYEFGKLNFPLDSLGINQLSLGLDSTVLLTGDYEAAYKVVNQRYDEILTCNNDRLLVLTGVLMGALGDEKSIPLFERAEKISLNPYVHFMSIHRKNALNVKRFSLNTIAFDEMNELDFKIESYIQYERVPQSEKLILKASVANLRALNYLKIRNEEEAYLEILKAFNPVSYTHLTLPTNREV